jgi:hypothetical protein
LIQIKSYKKVFLLAWLAFLLRKTPRFCYHSTMTQQPLEHLAGTIERVTFHSAETGFCVLRVNVRGQRETW